MAEDDTGTLHVPEGNPPAPDNADERPASRRTFKDIARLVRRLPVRGPAVRLTQPGPRPRRRSPSFRVIAGLLKTVFALAAIAVVGLAALVAWAVYDVPLDQFTAAEAAPAMVLEASDGTSLGRRGPFKAADVALADFPPQMIQAVVSIEDRRFYSHPGIDFTGIARAFSDNIAAGRVVQGGSTITQQLVKGMLGDDERTLRRKLREALVAVALELRLGKTEILHRYLNTVYMGGGAYGVPAAAQLYFNKSVASLTVPESAMLAGLIQAPSQLNPLVNLSGAQTRAALVVDAMLANEAIDANAAAAAKAAPAAPVQPAGETFDGTWFADWVADEAKSFASSQRGPLRVRTTFVPALQKIAASVISDTLAKNGAAAKVSEAALVAMRPDGAVLAMIGGKDYQTNQFNRAAQAQRQPGSSFKLFVYLAALRAGYTINSTVEDAPISVKDPTTGKVWSPDNYGGSYSGTVTLADAFAHSLNTAAVRLGLAVGPDKVIAAARDLGIDAPLNPVPSIALGTNEVTLVDLTAAYASVLSGAMPVQPWGISGVGNAGKDGLVLSASSPVDKSRPLDHRAELITLLQGVVQRGTGTGAALPGFAAGKTGTTQDYRDAWFIGFDSSLVVGVWVGNDDNASMNKITGGSLPASIWKAFMAQAAPYEAGLTATVSAAAPAPVTSPAAGPLISTAPAGCDVVMCSATYQSFRASDCTFQPYVGPRQICALGTPLANASPVPPTAPPTTVASSATPAPFPMPPAAIPTPVPANATTAAAVAPTSCDVNACSAIYTSFRASDCTFQPYGDVPRQACTKTSGGPSATLQARNGGPDAGPSGSGGVEPVLAQPTPPQRQARPPVTAAPQVPKSLLDWLAGQP